MEQATLDKYGAERTVPDELLEYVHAFRDARMEPIPRAEENRPAWEGRARSRGFCPKCWKEANYHGHNADYHRDDRMDPITDDDAAAHAYAETHLRP